MSGADRLRSLVKTATPGPWERGNVWGRAGVKPEAYGEGRCAFCARMGEPVWVGRMDINGTRMLAHKHRDPNPYLPDHLISGPDTLVAGNYDYEEGGIVHEADTRLIVLAPELALLVADMAEWMHPRSSNDPYDRDALLARVHALSPTSGDV